MSVTINGTVCRNCWDVDWARKVEAEQKEKHEADAARKAKEATERPDQTSGFDGQSATILDVALKGVAKPDPVIPAGDPATIAPTASSAPGKSINIFV